MILPDFACLCRRFELLMQQLPYNMMLPLRLWRPSTPPLLPTPPSRLPTSTSTVVWRTQPIYATQRRAPTIKDLIRTRLIHRQPGSPLPPTQPVLFRKSSWLGEWRREVRVVSRPQNLIGPYQRMLMIATGIPLLDRYSPCRRRRQDRSSFH
jgi:hypothetical protein